MKEEEEELICGVCASTKITTTKHTKKTCGPKNVKKTPNRKITYGYCYFKDNCGYSWDELSHL